MEIPHIHEFGHKRNIMKATVRSYSHASDYDRVGQFLVRTYSTTGNHINWLQPRWEYMHYHPFIKRVDLNTVGIWQAEDKIVAVVHPEHGPGTAYFEVGPAYAVLKKDMLAYAEEHICAINKDGGKALTVYINDRDGKFQDIAVKKGYKKQAANYETHSGFEAMSHFVVPNPFSAISVPDGFRLKSLAEDDDMYKMASLIWRGFNHGSEPPKDSIEDRKFMQSAPNFRKDLNIVAEAPDGKFVSYCGMWYEPVHKIAYVEPVATDPDYRRIGLASAVVLASIRRCGQLGATVAYVGAIKPIYLSIGFKQIYNCSAWRREWS